MYEVLSSLGSSAASCKTPTHGGESIHKGRGVLTVEMPQGEVVVAALLG